MKRILIAVLLLSCMGCGEMTSPTKYDPVANIRYFWEPSGKVCFATLSSETYYHYSVVSIASVKDEACKQGERVQ